MLKSVRRILACCCVLILVFSSLFLSGCLWGSGREYSRADNREYNKGDRCYFRDGRWYRRNAFGFRVAVLALDVGALIDPLPPVCSSFIAEGTTYYYDGRYYYKQAAQGGYVVVPEPMNIPS